jgi:hypothetical protein
MAFVLFGAVAEAGGAAAAVPGTSSHIPALCAKSFNPYLEPVSLLRSCGDTILPLQHVTALPGGGKAYSYGSYTQFTPPAHFDVLTASDKRLSEYGLPTRSQLGSRFYTVMRHYRYEVAPPKFMMISTSSAATTLPNWSGFNVNSHTYTDVSATWNEPGFADGGCQDSEFVQWAGLGGDGNDFLGQDGTTFNVPNAGAHQAWIEAINGSGDTNAHIVPVNLFATKGKAFDAFVSWDSLHSWYDYSMTNEDSGATYSGHSRVVGSDTITAEVITERPINGNDYTQLSDYGTLDVTQSEASYGTHQNVGFFTLPHNAITMDDRVKTPEGTVVSSPSTLRSDNSFTMDWNKCSVRQPAS